MSSKVKDAFEAVKEEGEVTMENLKTMKEDIAKELQQTREAMMKEMKMGREYFEDRPMLAIGIAFGVGLAIGAVIAIAIFKGEG